MAIYRITSPLFIKPQEVGQILNPRYLHLYTREKPLPRHQIDEVLDGRVVMLVWGAAKQHLLISEFDPALGRHSLSHLPFSLRIIMEKLLGVDIKAPYAGYAPRFDKVTFEEPKQETTRERAARQQKARIQEMRESHIYVANKQKTEVPKFDLQDAMDNPASQAITPVNIDPVSMLADDVEALAKEGAEFVKNPTLMGAASMAAVAIPGKYAEKIVDELPLKKLDKAMAKSLRTMKRFKVPCFEPGSTIKGKFKGKERELESHFARQLKHQEAGLNDLTVGEYIENRNRYKEMKRAGTGMAQENFRDRFSSRLSRSLSKSYKHKMSPIEAEMKATARTKEIMANLAALHDPDMIAGGADKVSRMGNKAINKSLGGIWSADSRKLRKGDPTSRLYQMDKQAQHALETLGPDAKMNVSLERCTLRGSK